MHFRSAAAIRWREEQAISSGTPAGQLMERAGRGLARSLYRLLTARNGHHCTLVAGRGNNGGDAIVAARILSEWGVACRMRLLLPPDQLKGAAREAWERHAATCSDAKWWQLCQSDEFWQTDDPAAELPPGAVVVDGLLGTGIRGRPTGALAAAIEWINRASRHAAIVAVDLPSGIDADSGYPAGIAPGSQPPADCPVVRADLTVTFDSPKLGFQHPHAWPLLGRLETVDIGLSGDPAPPSAPLRPISAAMLQPLLQPRPRQSHKGDYGRLLLLGGAPGMGGAMALTALGALQSGAGLITAVVPQSAALPLAALVPEVMTHAVESAAAGLSAAALASWGINYDSFDVVAAGPGAGTQPPTRQLVAELLAARLPRLLLDADALTLWATLEPRPRACAPENVIITPHPGEAARLLHTSVAEVQRNRPAAAEQLSRLTNATVVLKGCGTLVVAPGLAPCLNLTGNPGMATGGSGDLLTGIIAALWGQGMRAFDAAALGVYLHGTAGDLASWQHDTPALMARQLADQLAAARATLYDGLL